MLTQTASLTLLHVPMFLKARVVFTENQNHTDIYDNIHEYNIKEILEDETLQPIKTILGDKTFE